MTEDPYDILGVPRTATSDEIKKAYRKKARENHPDLNPDDPEAEERLKKINEAYDRITNPEKYAREDARRYRSPYNPTYTGYGTPGGNPFGRRGPRQPLRRRCARRRVPVPVGGNQLGGLVQHLEPGLLGAAAGGVGHGSAELRQRCCHRRRQLQGGLHRARGPAHQGAHGPLALFSGAGQLRRRQHRGRRGPDPHRPQGRPHQRRLPPGRGRHRRPRPHLPAGKREPRLRRLRGSQLAVLRLMCGPALCQPFLFCL